jgi:hypothetical protein
MSPSRSFPRRSTPCLRRALVLLVLATVAGCGRPTALTVLIRPPSGTPPYAIDVSAYDDFGRLASERVAKPALPGAVRLTGLPSHSRQLRVVVAGLDATGAVRWLAGNQVQTSVAANGMLPIDLSPEFADQDMDAVPDALDDCPSVYDPLQKSAVGFGQGEGDLCRSDVGSDGGDDDGGASDGASGASADMGPPLACPSGALCDSFDAQALDTTKWDTYQAPASPLGITIDNNRYFRGGGSLHVHLDAVAQGTSATAFIKEHASFPATTIHVRAYLFVPSAFSPDATAIMIARQPAAPFANIALQLEQGGFSMFSNVRPMSPTAAPAGSLARDTWVCVEWRVKVAVTGSAHVAVAGSALSLPALNGDLTASPALGELALGLFTSASNGSVPARDLWLDELVVSDRMVGCP